MLPDILDLICLKLDTIDIINLGKCCRSLSGYLLTDSFWIKIFKLRYNALPPISENPIFGLIYDTYRNLYIFDQ